MSGHPQQGHYDDGYGHHQQGNTDSYYQDDQAAQPYYDHNGGYADNAQHPNGHQQGGDGYYDESYVVDGIQMYWT
jgi:1,3-beta-glucan synthase